MTDLPGESAGADNAASDANPHGQQQAVDEVVYGPLQAWSRPHAAEGVVTVHFATRERRERRFTLTPRAARDLAIQLARHSKRVRRAISERDAGEPGNSA